MDVSSEAIEAAARKLHEIAPVHYYAQEFDDLSGNDMEEMREDVRQILEAGGKFLVADALEREADKWSVEVAKLDASPDDYDRWAANDVKEVVDGLRAQAASYRAGEA